MAIDDANFHPALMHLRDADPILCKLIKRIGPCGLRHDPRHFQSLVFAIVAQQVSMRAALTIMGRVWALFPSDGVTAASILALQDGALRAAGLTTAKARCIADVAECVARGQLDLDRFADLQDEQIVSQLVQVKGIGRWTAEMFLIFALNRPDVFPANDLGLRTAIMREYGLQILPDPNYIRTLATPWAPYRAIATWYFWRSLGNTGTGVTSTGWW